ncbi:hypothetical protein C0995_001453 [Termitomyces sp. Mi166|nr:hypothetical protein C0995_001453 [Termitomyces sp. Mi166\
MPQQALINGKGKGKAKVTEQDNDNEDKATQKLQEELKNFVVLTMFSNKQLMALLPLPTEYYETDVGLPWGTRQKKE